MHDTYIKDGLLYGLVDNKNDLEKVLELHSRATLSDYIKRYNNVSVAMTHTVAATVLYIY